MKQIPAAVGAMMFGRMWETWCGAAVSVVTVVVPGSIVVKTDVAVEATYFALAPHQLVLRLCPMQNSLS